MSISFISAQNALTWKTLRVNVCARKAIIEAAKRIINSNKVSHSYSNLNFGVTFWYNFQEDPFSSFYVKLLTDRQKERQTDRHIGLQTYIQTNLLTLAVVNTINESSMLMAYAMYCIGL